jgi:phosphate transport system ATP-binding protein
MSETAAAAARTAAPAPAARPAIEVIDFDLYYGKFHALKSVGLSVARHRVTALIGPSGCGKSSLLRCLNRMNDLVAGARPSGRVLLDGADIYGPDADPAELRQKVGMVFQRPNPFPLSVFENVVYGLRVAGLKDRGALAARAEESLKAAWLWDQLKDKLGADALGLPLDQQQRLCIARAIAVKPEVILMDEPASALDPIATAKIEELAGELKKDYTIAIVTHNMQQAARISDFTGYMLLGEMVEFGATADIFTNPRETRTDDYISGRYG